VINNDGYTVERVIHGLSQPYNDIPMWKYAEALKFFGPDLKSESHLVRTPDELEKLLNDPGFAEPTHPKVSSYLPVFVLRLTFYSWLRSLWTNTMHHNSFLRLAKQSTRSMPERRLWRHKCGFCL
jgi:TPP-dependent 2-oxoacid decarboxylase